MRTGVAPDDGATFAAHLRSRAAGAFGHPPRGPVDVTLIQREPRSASTLYRYRLDCEGQSTTVIVKVLLAAHAGPTGSPEASRPRLAPAIDPAVRCQFEFEALAAIDDRFRGLEKTRFGTVRVFDLLPAQNAMVMEAIERPTLRDAFTAWWRRPSASAEHDLEEMFGNAGAWLRAFHGMAAPHPAEPRLASAQEVIAAVARLTDYVSGRLGDAAFFERVKARFAERAAACLPERLPLGLSHGDYAMRNLFVGPGRRVTVFDTLASARTPIYEDIACFLQGFRMCWLNIPRLPVGRRARALGAFREALLAGYFQTQPIPEAAVALFEVHQVMSKWSALLAPPLWPAQRRSALRRRARAAVMTWYFRKWVRDALLPGEPAPSPARLAARALPRFF